MLFTCAPPVPPGGWVGPLSLWQGAGSETPPECSDSGGYPTEIATGGIGLQGASAICPSCSCGPPKGVACQIGTAQFFGGPGCTTPGGSLNVAQGICQGFVTLAWDPASVRWTAAAAGGGACIPQQSANPIIPPVQWDTELRACGDASPAGAGCGAGVCVPKPSPPFEEVLCVYQAGDLPCPAGAYSSRTVFFSTVNDTRACSGCDCGAPTGATCVGTLKLYTDTACSVDEVILTSVSQCSALPPDPTTPPPPYLSQRSMIYTGTYSGAGSCASIPSTPGGGVSADDPITVCCVP